MLIAEDDDHIALALKNIVNKAISSVKVTIVTDGQAALETLEKDKYNLVVSDWNMPRMTGLELLSKVRENKSTAQIPFLMLTARTDVDSVKSALGSGVTDYIAKPFEKNKIVEKILKFLAPKDSSTNEEHSRLIDNIVAKLKKGDIAFPVLPEMAFKAVEVINSKEASLQDVADLIKVDAGLTSKVISLANSSYYRAVKPIHELQFAIGRIGLRDSANLILAHTTSGLFNAEDPLFEQRQQALWEHSLATAYGARLLGKLLGHSQPESLYAIGMLHDIGKMLLIQVLMELSRVRDDITEQSVDETLEDLHIAFGVSLLKRWNFPNSFIEAIQYHHSYEQLEEYSLETQIISYANLIVSDPDKHMHEAEDSEVIKTFSSVLGITLEQTEEIRQEVISYVDEMKNMS